MQQTEKRLCWCGSGKPYDHCHIDFDLKLAALKRGGATVPPRNLIKNQEQIAGIRKSAALNVAVLDYVAGQIGPGVTTGQIDEWVHDYTVRHGGIPAPLNYEGFPCSVCTSVNNVVCHGIPSHQQVLREGDIVNVDVSTIVDGYYSDSSRMFCIGKVSDRWKSLVDITKKCVELGLAEVKPWQPIGNVGQAINDYARGKGCSVVREIGGHGIGLEFHEDPFVSYVAKAGTGMIMAPGLCFTIEPMVNLGTHRVTIDRRDGWTIRTADGKPSAQWEIQVLVTETGAEVLAW